MHISIWACGDGPHRRSAAAGSEPPGDSMLRRHEVDGDRGRGLDSIVSATRWPPRPHLNVIRAAAENKISRAGPVECRPDQQHHQRPAPLNFHPLWGLLLSSDTPKIKLMSSTAALGHCSPVISRLPMWGCYFVNLRFDLGGLLWPVSILSLTLLAALAEHRTRHPRAAFGVSTPFRA